MKTPFLVSLLLISVGLASCTSDVNSPDSTDNVVNGQGSTSNGDTTAVTDNNSQTTGGTDNNNQTTNDDGQYTITLSNNNVTLVEGATITVNVNIARNAGHSRAINLAVDGESSTDEDDITWQFSDLQLSSSENTANLTFTMGIGPMPLQRQVRNFRVIGTDGNSQTVNATLRMEIEPTSLPDVYLLVGQSNMVGFSEIGAKQSEPGELDAPNERIRQLNVTGNGDTNFPTAASFTNTDAIAVPGQRLTIALDPLHDGYDTALGGKEGTFIGLGMSFAKRAIGDTQSTVYLVPAAWSNTGFCKRDREDFEGELGWNAIETNNPALSGTLLHDRAIARANLALTETGGILRGILWHQGEADSDSMDCASLYENNIRTMVASLRTKIQQDARGSSARGANANVPFVLGTMSKGPPYDFQPEPKATVDSAHRNIKSIVPHSAFVSNDDLVPTAYPCGIGGECIHFGAASYREMGSRYYDFMLEAATN